MTGVMLGPQKYFFWNIDANVGPGCPNKIEDVHLVQLAYASAAMNPALAPAERAVYAQVVVGAPYMGGANDPLTIAIRTHQKSRGGTQDGHVSPIGPSGSYGPMSYMLIPLNNNIRNSVSNPCWPRIDQHPKCSPILKEAVKRQLEIPCS